MKASVMRFKNEFLNCEGSHKIHIHTRNTFILLNTRILRDPCRFRILARFLVKQNQHPEVISESEGERYLSRIISQWQWVHTRELGCESPSLQEGTPLAWAAGKAKLVKISDTDSAETNIFSLRIETTKFCLVFPSKMIEWESFGGYADWGGCVQERVAGFPSTEQIWVQVRKCSGVLLNQHSEGWISNWSLLH